MKTLILTALVIFCTNICQAQDTIFLRNDNTILAKVIEIGEANIVYKKAENQTGPDYKINISAVSRIVFENGTVETFKRQRRLPPHMTHRSEVSQRTLNIEKNKKLYPRDLPNNLITAGYYFNKFYRLTLFNSSYENRQEMNHGIFVKYERLIANEIVGIGISPFVALNQKQLGAKFNLTAYTKFFGRLRVGVGPSYFIARQHYRQAYNVTPETGSWQRVFVEDDKATIGSVTFSSVLLFHVDTKNLIYFNADIGSAVHSNTNDKLPDNWKKDRAGEGHTLGQISLGITHRF